MKYKNICRSRKTRFALVQRRTDQTTCVEIDEPGEKLKRLENRNRKIVERRDYEDNYEIIKILLDRGATLPDPHHVRCGCKECVTSRQEDSLRHSRSRINAYRALASPSLIALSSKDPILTAFELSWELRRLSFLEHEFKIQYQVILLILASQRIETVVGDLFGFTSNDTKALDVSTKRGALPSIIEWLILFWVSGLIWSEVKQLWDVGIEEYVHDMWNVIDFVTMSLYVATVALRIVAYYRVQMEMSESTGLNKYHTNLQREEWDTWDVVGQQSAGYTAQAPAILRGKR
ncbi:hypothetical protein RUM43_015081 [Polyplax serrata]|uniref:Transient receptor ion channel domain-containing protein n=1 Tax=Polyplax serrata TaxID=468196 RepID=A0AAN8NXJ5_POLSC